MSTTTETETLPGREYSIPAKSDQGATRTLGTSIPSFDGVGGLLSDRPLRRPNRTMPIDRLEDLEDLEALRTRRDEPSISWERVKRELGL